MTFDADKFLNQTVAGPMSTSVTPCPEGEYRAMIDDGEKWLSFSGGTNKQGEPWNKASVLFSILDDTVRAKLKREKVLVPMQMWLDLTPEGMMDTSEGKNVSIGRLRDAAGQMTDTAWTIGKLKGYGPFMVKVSQRADQQNPDIKYAEVTRVAKIS